MDCEIEHSVATASFFCFLPLPELAPFLFFVPFELSSLVSKGYTTASSLFKACFILYIAVSQTKLATSKASNDCSGLEVSARWLERLIKYSTKITCNTGSRQPTHSHVCGCSVNSGS